MARERVEGLLAFGGESLWAGIDLKWYFRLSDLRAQYADIQTA